MYLMIKKEHTYVKRMEGQESALMQMKEILRRRGVEADVFNDEGGSVRIGEGRNVYNESADYRPLTHSNKRIQFLLSDIPKRDRIENECNEPRQSSKNARPSEDPESRLKKILSTLTPAQKEAIKLAMKETDAE